MAEITTLLPTYRRPKLLARAIESVLNQTFTDFCLYIFDNASGDDTEEIVRTYQKKDNRIKYFCHATNIGLIQNFSFALQHVNTPYFSFLSDDDYLFPCFYETTLAGFKKYPEAGFSSGRTLTISEQGKYHPFQFLTPQLSGYYPIPEGIFALSKLHAFPIWTGILYKHTIVKKIGGIDQSVGIPIDLDFTLKAAAAFPFVITPTAVAAFVVWKRGTSSQADLDAYHEHIIRSNVAKLLQIDKQLCDEILQNLCTQQIARIRYHWTHFLLAGKIGQAKKAKNTFFAKGGSINSVLRLLLEKSETSWVCRCFFKFLFWMRKNIQCLRAFRDMRKLKKDAPKCKF